MLIILFCFVAQLAFLDRALRLGRIDLLVLRTRYELFRIRDLLRNSAIWGDLDPHTWVFDYLDSSITKTASSLQEITVYRDVLAGVLRSPDPEKKRQYDRLMFELGKPKNSRLRVFHESYISCLQDFLYSRHRFVFPLLDKAVGFFPRRETKQSLKQHGLRALNTNPDISTLHQYCHK